MALNPTDPAKAQVWVRGEAPNQVLDIYVPRGARGEVGPQGPIGPPVALAVSDTVTGPETPGATGPQGVKGDKGDTGGLTQGPVMNNTDANTLTTPGTYRLYGGVNITPDLNWPGNNTTETAIVIVVAPATTWVTQIFYPVGDITASRVTYRRNMRDGVWTVWTATNSTRVDQAAGRAIYQWDNVNSREQLIYGDTGWRTLTPANGWTASHLGIRRVGQIVYIATMNLNGSAATSDAVSEVLPSGFRCTTLPVSVRVPVMTSTAMDTGRAAAVDISSHTLRILGGTHTGVTSGQVYTTYPTNDAWPTTLPGVANSTIPNI